MAFLDQAEGNDEAESLVERLVKNGRMRWMMMVMAVVEGDMIRSQLCCLELQPDVYVSSRSIRSASCRHISSLLAYFEQRRNISLFRFGLAGALLLVPRVPVT